MRKTALRQITDNARQFGAGPLFNQILPLLMEKTLEDQERHLLVKVIDRVLYKLDDRKSLFRDIWNGILLITYLLSCSTLRSQDLGRHRTLAYRPRLLC